MTVLFVHPKTPTFMVEIFPMSLPALVARVPVPVRGMFEAELTDDDIRGAHVVLMDLHWYLSIPAGVALAARIKRCSPRTQVVVGGVAATMFAEQLLAEGDIDFVVRGDAERPMAALVAALLAGESGEDVPNVVHRDFRSTARYAVTTEDLDAGNYRDLSFWPSMERRVLRLHAQARGGSFPVFPHLVSFRGCPLACEGCSGALTPQRRLFGRSWVRRSAAPQREDLQAWSARRDIRFVSVFHDFASLSTLAFTREILAEEYDLSVYYEWYRVPRAEALDAVLSAFRGGTLLFSLDQFHATSDRVGDVDALIDRIRTAMAARRFNVQLNFVSRFQQQDPAYAAAIERIRRATGVWMHNADFWWQHNPMPDDEGHATDADYRRCFDEQDRRFRVFNTVFRGGIVAHRYAPWVAEAVARRFLAHYRPVVHEPFVTWRR
ncbi:MAG: cobalamin B12-binding domain-containing protein [Alphaproteobacteria bacterium]|nr:cobalamin B12-binding domain-containing protein [Alphaproteobacteria bacterium]